MICSASIKYNASVSMDIMLVRIPCGFRDAALTLYHRCVPEVINLLLHRSFSSCCSSRASAWSTLFLPLLHLPTSLLTVILRLRPTLFSSTVLSMLSVVSSLISFSPSLISRVRDAWLLGRLVTWLLGYGL